MCVESVCHLLINTLPQRWWDILLMCLWLYCIRFLRWSWDLKILISLGDFEEASCHVMTCPMERTMWLGNEGFSLTSSQWIIWVSHCSRSWVVPTSPHEFYRQTCTWAWKQILPHVGLPRRIQSQQTPLFKPMRDSEAEYLNTLCPDFWLLETVRD